ncbi:MAG TPA: CopD family protein [Methylocystis sp.]|nr:CopD family protein [Methylocystis sp.]
MELAFIRFIESLASALAVGLLLAPRLIDENGQRFKPAIALLALLRFLLGFVFIVVTARGIIPEGRPFDFDAVLTFSLATTVGRAFLATQLLALAFAGLAAARLFASIQPLDIAALVAGGLVLAATSVTGHAIDDSFTWWTQASFLLHTLAGLTWIGGLIGLVWWMFTGRDKPPEVAARLAERWSTIAKVAIALVFATGLVMAWENVSSFANLLATPYGRLLSLKLLLLAAAMLAALALALYLNRRPAGEFDFGWYGRVGAAEAAAAVGLLFIAGWIAVITPASHETDLYWPLPFRLSWAATWGYVGMKLPWTDVPGWYLAPAWSGLAALVFSVFGAALWLVPRARPWRRFATPAALTLAALGVVSSFATVAYPDTYADPAVDYTAESVARGQKDFAENCVACHGATGEGNGEMAKTLKVPPADLTAPHVGNHTIGDIFHWLTFGGTSGVMPGFKDVLDSDDRWDLINFLLMMSYSNRARFIGATPMVQWLIAPDFQLVDPEDKITTLYGLRGVPTLVSFARCNAAGVDETQLDESLAIAAQTAKAAGAHHVTVYQGGCPAATLGRQPTHARAVEAAYSVINRYPNEIPTTEIAEAHYLIDRSGYVRARFRHFAEGDVQAAQLASDVAALAKEPFVIISLHSH